jgi:hypothetical protein
MCSPAVCPHLHLLLEDGGWAWVYLLRDNDLNDRERSLAKEKTPEESRVPLTGERFERCLEVKLFG